MKNKVLQQYLPGALYPGRRNSHLVHKSPVRGGFTQKFLCMTEFVSAGEVFLPQCYIAADFQFNVIKITVIPVGMIVDKDGETVFQREFLDKCIHAKYFSGLGGLAGNAHNPLVLSCKSDGYGLRERLLGEYFPFKKT